MSARALWRIGAFAIAIALAVLGLAANCSPSRRRDWDEGWSQRARAHGLHWRVGTRLEVNRYEGTPSGPQKHVELWQLLRSDSTSGEFEVRVDDGEPRIVNVGWHPAVPQAAAGGGGHGIYPVPAPMMPMRVPAGRFDCGHTWRDHVASDGRVMRQDEWWAPNVPVPVMSWTRWEGTLQVVPAPPAEPRDVATGMTWSVLKAIRQP